MPSEEGKQVLELLAQGKIDADQAYRLLRALGDVPGAPPPPPAPGRVPSPPGPPGAPGPEGGSGRGRTLRIKVTERGRQKVNVAIPLTIARIGKMKLASSALIRGHLAKFGIDLDEIMREVESVGRIVDVNDEDARVEIFVE